MRKAFDANVPKFRPRLRNAVASTELQEAAQAVEPEVGHVEVEEEGTQAATSTATLTSTEPLAPALSPPGGGARVTKRGGA